MNIDWILLGKTLALVLIIEGLGPFLFPEKWRATMRELSLWPTGALRILGVVLLGLGVLVLLGLG